MTRAPSDLDLLAKLERLAQPRILVLGDLILDRYTWGNAERVSQEAPVIVLRTDVREARLGGAANVAHMLRGLEAEVVCAGVIGEDAAGHELRRLLDDAGVDTAPLLPAPDRPTTVKERFIGRAANRHPHQILRVDSEIREPLARELEQTLGNRLPSQIERCQAVLVSDYDKGVCTPWLLRQVIDAARRREIPVLVDPLRGNDFSRYRGATTMTPNRLEAELATGIRIATEADAFRAGQMLCRQLDLSTAAVTLDCDGMALVDAQGQGQRFSTCARAVYDITGAGDMVLATIGLALASGLTMADACRLANLAAGLEVEKVGVALVSRAEMRGYLQQSSPTAAVDISTTAMLASVARPPATSDHPARSMPAPHLFSSTPTALTWPISVDPASADY